MRAEQSATQGGNVAENAIDLDITTIFTAKPDSSGTAWIKITLDRLHCVEKVKRYKVGGLWQTWTCTKNDCSECEGSYCGSFRQTVSTEGTTPKYLPSISDCKYGDEVLHTRVSSSTSFSSTEFVIIGKQGNGGLEILLEDKNVL